MFRKVGEPLPEVAEMLTTLLMDGWEDSWIEERRHGWQPRTKEIH